MKIQPRDTELLQRIFDSSIEGILVVDDQGSIIDANASCERIFGYREGELKHKKLDSLLPKKFRKKHKTHRSNYAKKPEMRIMGLGMDLWGLKKDGSEFPLDISLSPSVIEGNQVTIAFIRDSSILKSAINAKVLSGNRMDEAQRLAHVGSWFWDLQTNEREWSDEFYKIFGLPPGDNRLNAETAEKFIHPDDRENASKVLENAIENQIPYKFEKRIVRPDGSVRYVITKGKITYNKLGKPIRMMGTMQDITDLNFLKDEFAASETRNKDILKAIPDLMFVLNAQGVYLEVNASDPSILLVPKDQIIGKNINDILSKELSKKIMEAFDNSKKTNTTQIVEYSLTILERIAYYEARVEAKNNGNFWVIVRDITNQKESVETLYIRNQALESAKNGIVITDAEQPDYPIIYANDAFSKLTGYSKNELMGKNCRFLQGVDRAQDQVKIMATAIAKGMPSNVELRNYKKDGTLFWNEVHITPIYNDNAVLTHFIGIQNDVTERKLEELLKDDIRLILEQIANNEPMTDIANAIVKTIEGHFEGCIASILLLNQNRDTLHNLASPNLPDNFRKAIEGIKIGNGVGSCGTSPFLKEAVLVDHISKDSLWSDYKELAYTYGLKSCWSFPIFSSNKKVLGTFAIYNYRQQKPEKVKREIMEELTYLASVAIEHYRINEELKEGKQQLEKKVAERTKEVHATVQKLVESNLSLEDQMQVTKIAERKALDSQALFAAIAEYFPNGVIVVIDNKYKVKYINGQELKKFGLKSTSYEKKAIDEIDLFSTYQKNALKKSVRRTLDGKHQTFEIEFMNMNYAVYTLPLKDVRNKANQALFVYNNITYQKEIELGILNALQIEKDLNELKSRFVSMASHEFRTPLSAILSSATLIGKQNGPDNVQKREKYVNQIQNNVRSLVVILNDFLSLSKMEEGKTISQPERFDLVRLVKDVIEEIEINQEADQQIYFQSIERKIQVFLDAKLIHHALVNLISNATKYSEQNTKIEISITKNDGKVIVQVADQGMGIPLEEQSNLFNRFFRANNATNIQGTGLGLYIVKQYTELMGGTVSFKSKQGKGTTFYLNFPLLDNRT
ncbi:PAS domain S-box protein [Maribacter sp. ACAM166]|uniref:PAS domain S-box protein n=1 Tax=Maribacter sp. ACAM166 TaxID=2508996 RepID=UPI001485A401|nr:PAS domain S-box protein [Maribacter sp. ACAM166]